MEKVEIISVTHSKSEHISLSYLFVLSATSMSYKYKMSMVITGEWGIGRFNIQSGHTGMAVLVLYSQVPFLLDVDRPHQVDSIWTSFVGLIEYLGEKVFN